MNPLELTLGILTAVGGAIDIGDLVFNMQTGALFGFSLLWITILGTITIVLYSEMAGRVVAVTQRPVFDLVRDRLGFGLGFIVLVVTTIINVMTCAAEIGGIAFILHLLFGLPYIPLIFASLVILLCSVGFLSFDLIEQVFGLMGLFLIAFVLAAIFSHPNWSSIGSGFIPSIPKVSNPLLFAYFAVGLFGSLIMPYEVFFYSSGGVEDKWDESKILFNRVNAVLGYGLGLIVIIGLIVLSKQIFQNHGINPQVVGSAALATSFPLGKWGLLATLIGMFFAICGAAIETCFSGAYNIAQFSGWEWGKAKKAIQAPRFTITWILIFIVAAAITLTGIDPVALTQVAVILSVVALPLTYFPILLVVKDPKYMNKHINNRITNIIAWIFFVFIILVSLSALPLMILTNGGKG